MSKILDLLKEFDIAAMLPEMGKFTGWIVLALKLFLLAGPIIMIVMGAIYCFAAPKEANHRLGHRSRWSMSSVDVWKYAQRISGIVYMGSGGLLTITMLIVIGTFKSRDLLSMVVVAIICAMVEVAVAAVSWLLIEILLRRYYDINGRRKRYI